MQSLILCKILMTRPEISYDAILQLAIDRVAVTDVQKDFDPNQVALSLVSLDSGQKGSVRGEQQFITASVVKLFWLAFAVRQVESNKVAFSTEFKRAARDMIIISSNDATGYIVNATTGANPGPELPEKEFQVWLEKRQSANRHFAKLGYKDINILHRTYNEEAYGVEKQAWGSDQTNRNKLTTDAAVRLMGEIVEGKAGNAASTKWMLSLLRRVPLVDIPGGGASDTGYIGIAMPSGTEIFGKTGSTSLNRHDVAAFTLPDGRRFVLAIFTNYGPNEKIIPALTREVISQL